MIGFLLVATFLGALEIVLDRGLEDDWFGSSFIVTFTVDLRHRVRADDPLGVKPEGSHDRHAHGRFASVWRLLPGDGRDRRDPLRDDPVSAAHGADGVRLHRDLGRPRAFAGRSRHHGDDVRRRAGFEPDPAKIPDHDGRDLRRDLDVSADQRLRRRQLLVPGAHPHGAWRGITAHLYPNYRSILRRDPSKQG